LFSSNYSSFGVIIIFPNWQDASASAVILAWMPCIPSHGCECIAHNLSFKTFGKLPSMALDSGFPRQSLTGAGSAGMTILLALAEASF
jgi:hypothetical protein